MSKRAEEYVNSIKPFHQDCGSTLYNWQQMVKCYQQAEKDLELGWEDIRDILDLYDEVTSMDYCSDIYEEVLKRFKAMKEK